MSENYETITGQRHLQQGDRVRVTVEGTVWAVARYDDPNASTHIGGVLIQTDYGSNHEVYLDKASYDSGVNAVKLTPEPELAQGQIWRGGDAKFVVIGNDDEGYVLHDVRLGNGFFPNEFFARYRHNNELLREAV